MTKPMESFMTKEHGKIILNRENEIIVDDNVEIKSMLKQLLSK